MKKTFVFLCLIVSVFILSFRNDSDKPAVVADKIYINGTVLTIDSANSIAQAVAIKDGKIVTVGSTADMQKLRNGHVSREVVEDAVRKGFKNNIQVYIHANGDAAIDTCIFLG